jgi:hypothetical protein
MRVIVDEGIGETSPLWQTFQAWLGNRSAEIVWLATRYPAMPDVEVLDKLLTPDTILLTRDGVLHNRALAQGVRSFTFNAQGQLTRKPLPLASRRVRAPAPSVLKHLRLLLDSGVVELAMSCNPIFVILTSSNPLFFKGLKNELRASGHIEASDPGIQQERRQLGVVHIDLVWAGLPAARLNIG